MNHLAAYLFIFLGGAIGALSRFGIQEGCRRWTALPGWGAIFIVNVLGSFVIGFTIAWLTGLESAFQADPGGALRRFVETQQAEEGILLLAVGFCGAFTTFSTFSLDNHFLFQENRWHLAFNVVGSVLLCLVAVLAGWSLGQSFAG